MQKVNTNFKYYFIAFGLEVAIGLALIFLVRTDWARGLGPALILLGAIGFFIDGFAERRAVPYTSALVELAGQVQVYALEEIVAEKLHERGWSRSRARDYCDLWRVLGAYQDRLDLSDFLPFLGDKCAVRNVSFKGSDDFFPKTMLDYVEKTWVQWLGPRIPDLPDFDTVIGELRPQITSLVSSVQ